MGFHLPFQNRSKENKTEAARWFPRVHFPYAALSKWYVSIKVNKIYNLTTSHPIYAGHIVTTVDHTTPDLGTKKRLGALWTFHRWGENTRFHLFCFGNCLCIISVFFLKTKEMFLKTIFFVFIMGCSNFFSQRALNPHRPFQWRAGTPTWFCSLSTVFNP